MVEVNGDGGVRPSDGYSRAEVRRHLQEAERGGREGQGCYGMVVVHQRGV